jgi:hypothetical protein
MERIPITMRNRETNGSSDHHRDLTNELKTIMMYIEKRIATSADPKSNGFIGTQIEAMQIMWSVLRVNGQVPNVQI